MDALRAYAKYCVSTNEDFVCVRCSACNGYFKREFYTDHCEARSGSDFIDRLRQWFDNSHPIKQDEKTSVHRFDARSCALTIKRYHPRGWVHALRQTCTRTRALRTWVSANLLQKVSVQTPNPLACVEVKRFGLITESYIVTEYLPGDSLYLYIAKYWPDQAAWQAIVAKMKTILDILGRYRITHGDLKHSNIIISHGDVSLTDLDGVRWHRDGPFYRLKRAKDLRMFENRLSRCEIEDPPLISTEKEKSAT